MKARYYSIFLMIGLCGLLWLCSSSCQRVKGYKLIKLGHGLDVSHPVHAGMVKLGELVEQKSDGKLRIDIYPSEQLGKERELLELLQIGSLGMTKVSSAVLENFSPNIRVLGLPYIFRSKEHHYNVLDGEIGQSLLEDGDKYWLRGICFYDAGSRSFYTKNTPVESPTDLSGLKIRVQQSQTAMDMVSLLGGAPTPIAWGELYTALQQGLVDGAENNAPSFVSSRHYELCKYYSINEHTAVPDVLIMSTHVWNGLTEQEKKWVMEAARESVIYQRKVWAKSVEECLDIVKKAGVTVSYPKKEPFAEKVAQMYEQYKQEPEIYELIQKIQAVN